MRLFGHPLHPLLVAFPIGLLALLPLWDGLSWFGIARDGAQVAYWTELVGLVASGLAVLTGLVDFARLSGEAVVATALKHATFAITAISWYAIAFALRTRSEPPSLLIFALDVLGALTLAGAGWFGGHLVFHHAVGVDAKAQKPAPPP